MEKKPVRLQDKLVTPDQWTTVGEVACQMEENKLNLKEVIEKLTCEYDSNRRKYEKNTSVTIRKIYHKSKTGLII